MQINQHFALFIGILHFDAGIEDNAASIYKYNTEIQRHREK